MKFLRTFDSDSGVSRWLNPHNPLPDIALDTLIVSRLGDVGWTDSLSASPTRDQVIKSR